MPPLDPWIIEEIKKRERERREQEDHPQPQIPLHEPPPPEKVDQEPEEKRGPVTIDI